ncbi:glutaminase A [Xylona heveae TC161]|uniref:Glutaminase A n=1 Tax=Xylona heveae (strain CBS 132557 / TC161) TaxID=1328760 RepID=A0A165GGR1_XYLHT|nr:glutaminase A [Xylona heveae TC161]KZF22166.1 glutaminase A [Xylona heveae TC161]
MRLHVPAVIFYVTLLASFMEASVLHPPVLPLIVRNPYLSTWLNDARNPPWNKWPMFWTGQEIGFSVLASVPDTDKVYPLLGRPHDSLRKDDVYNVSFPIYKGATYDASTTNLTYLIPAPSNKSRDSVPVEIVLSFLSPVTPTSTLRQSIPAAYLGVHVQGNFNVNLYIDVNGQWVSGDRGSRITWQLLQTNLGDSEHSLKTWQVQRETEQLLTEYRDQAEWGALHFTGPANVRHEAGTSALLRQRFSRTGTLQDAIDDSFRSIMDEEPVFAFSKSFKLNTSSAESGANKEHVLFTLSHIQDPVVQFASARGLTYMRPLWKSWFASVQSLITFHYFDFRNAFNLAANYSQQLAKDAYKSGSDKYVDIVALSARQTLGATTFAGTREDPILFLKEISSNGNFQTIDVIFPSFPFFLYTNPRWLAYLLEPLIEHMLSGQYPNKYAMHDLGYHFPNATGHPDGRDEYMPVEECGNILIMGLALVNSLRYNVDSDAGSPWAALGKNAFVDPTANGIFSLQQLEERDGIEGLDGKWGGGATGIEEAKQWVTRSYKLWKQWTGYLVEFSLEPHRQLSTDDFAGWLALQTNLALKGIIGIKAMSDLADIAGIKPDAKEYKNISDAYIKKWQEYAISRDGTHAKLAYDWYGSWTTLYNLFADALLCFHLPSESQGIVSAADEGQKPIKPSPEKNESSDHFIPNHIYKIQSDWYHAVRQRYGLPLDNRHLYTKSDWEFFAAAVTSNKVRGEILDSVALWVNETSTDRPMTDLYDTEGTGGFPGPNFFARPVVGGHFAFLALERACGGKVMAGLSFLDEGERKSPARRPASQGKSDVNKKPGEESFLNEEL